MRWVPVSCMRALFLCLWLWVTFQTQAQIQLFRDFENGNGHLIYQNIPTNEVSLMPEIKRRDRALVWFYCRLTGFRRDTVLTLHLPFQKAAYAPDPLLVKMAGFWHRIPAETHKFFKTYRINCQDDTIFLATGIPYTYTQLQEELKKLKGSKPYLKLGALCRSEEGLEVPMMRFQLKGRKPRGTLYFQSRQHAFESPSSYFIQGIWKELIAQFDDSLSILRNYQVLLVPMVDVDNVKAGAYGKDQFPVDFNRSWVEIPHWNAVRSIQKLLKKAQSEAPLVFTLDCHAPHPISRIYSHYYLALADTAAQTLNLKQIMRFHENEEGYKMAIQRNNRIKPGECNFNKWVHESKKGKNLNFPLLKAGTTYEQSWQEKPNGTPYTPEEMEKSGRAFLKALAAYLQQSGH